MLTVTSFTPTPPFPLQELRVIEPMAPDGVADDALLQVMHACCFNPGCLPDLQLPDCF